MIDPELSSLEIIGIAVRAERESFNLYSDLANRIANPAARAELARLADEETQHEKWLSEYYMSMTRSRDIPPVPDVHIKMFGPRPDAQMDVMQIIDLAIGKERLSEEVYAEAERRSTDASGRRLLGELVEFERSHARKLAALIDHARRNPAWIEDPHGRAIQLEGP